MRSGVYLSTLLFLFPVLISGFPFLRRDGNDTDTSSSNSTSASDPVNSTSSAAPSDSGSGNSTDSSGNSTSSVPSDLATGLMSLNLLIAQAFYEQAAVVSQGLGDTNASALLGAGALINGAQLYSLNPAASDLNCTFNLSPVMDNSNTVNMIDSIIYLESIKVMGSANLLSNTSLNLSQTEQGVLNDIYEQAEQFAGLAANITMPNLPLGNHPNLTQEDYNSFLAKFNPSCLNDLGLSNFPHHPSPLFGAPHAIAPHFVVGSDTAGCSDLSAVFCQLITANLNDTAIVSSQPGTCDMQASAGLALYYTTRTADPLSTNLTERQGQDGNICEGPDLFLLH